MLVYERNEIFLTGSSFRVGLVSLAVILDDDLYMNDEMFLQPRRIDPGSATKEMI